MSEQKDDDFVPGLFFGGLFGIVLASGVLTLANLDDCPHGNEAFVHGTPRATWIDSTGPCPCGVAADTPDRARRAWVALCSAD